MVVVEVRGPGYVARGSPRSVWGAVRGPGGDDDGQRPPNFEGGKSHLSPNGRPAAWAALPSRPHGHGSGAHTPHKHHFKGGSFAPPYPFFCRPPAKPPPSAPFRRAHHASGLHLPPSKGRKARPPLPNWEHWEGSGRLLSTGSLPLKSPFGPRHPSNAPSDVTGLPETGSNSGLADQKIGSENK